MNVPIRGTSEHRYRHLIGWLCRHGRSLSGRAAVALLLCAAAAPLALSAAPASYTDGMAPHIANSVDTDACAMCHRGHTAANTAVSNVATGSPGNALLASGPDAGDKGLCYSCHGVEALGSSIEVQSSFEASSGHAIYPETSAYGVPAVKSCGTCHDPHGAARNASAAPYPALLRVRDASGTEFYEKDVVCTTCHPVRAGNLFPGAAVWSAGAHAAIATDPAGTGVVCSVCHDPHGSDIAPAIVSVIPTPALAATVAVTANDRSLCLACHSGAVRSWPGSSAYATGAHAGSAATVAVSGEYASADSSRTVGECQSCHSAMGSANASGTLIADLLAAEGRAVCDRCHSSAGPAMTDLASFAWEPEGTGAELFASFASSSAASFDRLYIFSRESSAAGAPSGPAERDPVTSAGPMAAGDIDGDGFDEVVLADASAARVAVIDPDPLLRVRTVTYALTGFGAPAYRIAVGQVFDEPSGREEVIVVSAAGEIAAFRLGGGVLSSVATTSTSGSVTGIATGDVAGGSEDEVVITTTGPDMLRVLGAVGANLSQSAASATLQVPTAVAVGELDAESVKKEIAVALGGSTTNAVSFHQGDATLYESGGGPLPVSDPVSIVVGDLVADAQCEVALVSYDGSGAALLRTVTQVDGVIGSVSDTALPNGSTPSSLDIGDADADGVADLVIALSGSAPRTAAPLAPSIRVYSESGGALALSFSLASGGTEAAGRGATALVSDIGYVPVSRHPVSVVASAHIAAEQVPAPRHVECVDCHDPHEAVSAGTTALPGPLVGAFGVVVGAPTVRATATAEFQVCYTCHSAWDPSAARDIAAEVDPSRASYHPVEASAQTVNTLGTTMEGGFASGDMISCGSCHGRVGAGAQGPHRSAQSPLLSAPLLASRALDAQMLCRTCHRAAIYVDGSAETSTTDRSGFFDTRAGVTAEKRTLHAYHAGVGVTCRGCHDDHGAAEKHLLTETSFAWTERVAVGGECVSACHDTGAVYSYER